MLSITISRLLCSFFGVLFLLANTCTLAQNQKVKSIKTGLGFAFFDEMDSGFTGDGFVYLIGYQKDIGKGRFRLNPNMLIGFFDASSTSDVRDQYQNTISLEGTIEGDIIRYKSLSLLVGIGGFVSHMRGYIDRNTRSMGYIRKYYIGLNGKIGFRIAPKKNKVAFEFLPLSGYMGTQKYGLLSMLAFNVVVKLHHDD